MSAAMTGAYTTEADAQKRVVQLIRTGRWPGIITHPDGSASLTFDPPELKEQT